MAKKKSAAGRSVKRRWLWPLVIITVAFVVRLIHLLSIESSPLFSYLQMDSLFYYETALKFAAGTLLAEGPFFKAPLYPILLGMIYKITGPSYFLPRLLQIMLGSTSCLLIYLLARRFYSTKIAITSGMTAALYGILIYFDNEILIPALIVFLDLLSILLLLKFEESGRKRMLFISALLLGLSSIARPNVLIFLPAVLYWLWRLSKRAKMWKKTTLLYVLGVVLMILPVTIANYTAGEELIFFGHYGGINLAIGNNEWSDGRTAVLPGTSAEFWPGYYDAVTIAEEHSGRKLTPGEVSDFWYRQGVNYIVTEPLDWLKLQLRKLSYLIGAYEISNNKHIYFFAEQSPILKLLIWDKLVFFPLGIILPFAVMGLLMRKGQGRKEFLIRSFVLLYAVSILIFFVTSRYRLPMLPFVVIWAAAGFWTIADLYRKSNFSRFCTGLAILIVAIVICNGVSYIPGLSPRLDSEYEGRLQLGGAYYNTGRYELAAQQYYQAVKLNPRSARAFTNLANSLHKQNEDSLAVDYYKNALAVDRDFEAAQYGLARIYKATDQIDDLWELIEHRLGKERKTPWALKSYAYLHTVIQEPDLAAELYEEAYQADKSDLEALFKKAEVYLQGDFRLEAQQEFERIIRLAPNSVEAHANLGQVYARQRRFDDAIQQYEWVIRRDPDHPAAYFNLATIYIQTNNVSKAQQMIERVIYLGGSNEAVELLQRRVETLKQSPTDN